MSKALLIKSQIDKNGGEVGKWNNFNNAPSYIPVSYTHLDVYKRQAPNNQSLKCKTLKSMNL